VESDWLYNVSESAADMKEEERLKMSQNRTYILFYFKNGPEDILT
jgi:hypothetical protein